MNTIEIERLAAAVNALRPDWPLASLRTGIARDLATRPYRDAAVALVWVAVDSETQTPRRVLESGPWWTATTAAATPADRARANVPLADLCVTCSRSETDCREVARRAVDDDQDTPHEYLSRHQAAIQRARADRRDRDRPDIRERTPTDSIATTGVPMSPQHRAQIDAGIAAGKQRWTTLTTAPVADEPDHDDEDEAC